MRVLLFSDLHLDAPFRWAGPEAGRRWRARQKDVLRRIVGLAREERVDAVLCAGDLYEQDCFTPDTVRTVEEAFAEAAPARVFLAPGNHDWLGPGSLYVRADFGPHVHLFRGTRLEPVELAPGLVLWGGAHHGPARGEGFLEGFRAGPQRGATVHLALFHGSERAGLRREGEDKVAHAPFDASAVPEAGLAHAFVGHYHRPADGPFHTYAGNPDPLAFGETGERGVVIATVGPDGRVAREWRSVALTELHDLEVDLTGCTSQAGVRDRVDAALAGRRGLARVTLTGELAAEIDLAPADLERTAVAEATELEAVRVGVSPHLRVAYDVEAIAREPTVRGQFVRDVLAEPDLDADARRAVLVTGLRALEGRQDLEAP